MKQLLTAICLFLGFQAYGQDVNSELNKLFPFIKTLHSFSKNIPQEKVYLHFDNTSYYEGDDIWFKCYVTTAQHQLSPLSKTLYVELLNPGGQVIDKRILKIENGQCHGDFTLNQLPFHSGFHEVRAYTRYMLNFGEDIIFSRLLPVFNKPKEEGNYEEKEMLKYGSRDYPMKREKPEKGKTVNLHFFPEGGNLVEGIESRVAFEATDEVGNPIEVTGVVMDDKKQTLGQFTTLHEGRGVFSYTAGGSKQKNTAEVEYDGKKYRFDMPAGLPQGVVMETDNLTYPDSLGITLRKNAATPAELFGVAIINGGKWQNFLFAHIESDEVSFKMNKSQLPLGVSQIILFNKQGEVLSDRLIFAGRNEQLDIRATTGKRFYVPHELVDMELSVTDGTAKPVPATFSLSVRDDANGVGSKHTIQTDLLLMSEIKGYVRNPGYYFEQENDTRQAALDLLLMVQGWRRYSWKQMAGVEPFEIKYAPEQGIETRGKIVTFIKQTAKPKVDVSLFLHKGGEENKNTISDGILESFVSDDQGRFSFVSDVSGKWNMVLTVEEKGKKKDHLILLEKAVSPEPAKYRYTDMQVELAEQQEVNMTEEEIDPFENDDLEAFLTAYKDSLAKLGIDEKIYNLPEVTVKGKRTREQGIYRSRSTAAAYYDVSSELDDIYDKGVYVGKDIHELLKNMSPDFSTMISWDREWILYKNRMPLFIVNYEPMTNHNRDYLNYLNINIQAIKNIYINETGSTICRYVEDPKMTCFGAISMYGCVVLIETYPEKDIPAEPIKGTRKTFLDGYSTVKEFYSPDYSVMPGIQDYRRTLYWNPSVTTDETGHAKIEFYNNSRCTHFTISAETVTSQGLIGVYKAK